MNKEKLRLWLQVTIEDTVAELFYTTLAFALLAFVLAWFRVIPFPAAIFGCVVILLAVLLAARAFRNLLFLRRADPVVGRIGREMGRFKKWTEHLVHFEIDGAAFQVKHSFLRKEVTEGEPVLLLTHARKRTTILVVRRMQQKESLVD